MNVAAQYRTDVLVIGAGGAGLRAALAAAEAGCQVILANKGPIARSGITLTAAGGMQAPYHPEDSPKQFLLDTMQCGYDLGDMNLINVLVNEACSRVLDVERYGGRFVRNPDGSYALGQFPGQSKPRNLFVKGGGLGLASALAHSCSQQQRITVLEDFFVSGLTTGKSSGENVVAGAMGINLKTGALTLIHAKAVIMATGGCQWLWEVNDCPTDATGDGIAYAYRAGANLVDMEMVLFYPSVVVWPPSLKGAFVHYEFLATEVFDGNIYDRHGWPVLPKPLPVRDEAMRLMEKAIRDGRGAEHSGLLWYVGDSPKGLEYVQTKLALAQYKYIKTHGVDPAAARIEVAPGAHFLMGGIHINEQCQTSIKGLFATPECAGNIDGANRIAGSGITATQVFGAIAGECACKWATVNLHVSADPASVEEEICRVASRIAKGRHSSKVAILRGRLRSAVQEYAGVERDQSGLEQLIQIAMEVQAEAAKETVSGLALYNQALVDLLQLEILCDIAQLVAGSALLRQESRGHHYRTDFPFQDNTNWHRHTLAFKTQKGPQYGTKQVVKNV